MSRSYMCFGLGKRGNGNEDEDSKKKDSSGGSKDNTKSRKQPSAGDSSANAQQNKDSKTTDSPSGSRINTESRKQPSAGDSRVKTPKNKGPKKDSPDQFFCSSRLDAESSKQASARDNAQQKTEIVFTYEQLAAATDNFSNTNLIKEGAFGVVHKGKLEDTGQLIAVKRPARGRYPGHKEFLAEVMLLFPFRHPNLIHFIGYCVEGGQRFLVHEYIPHGSLADHLHGLKPDRQILNWDTRMKIAAGVAKGLESLHEVANPPVIHGDIKAVNILLREDFQPKLSDFGLPRLSVSMPVTGIPGYCAPEYILTEKATEQSDIYSFGVVLLELITGRPAMNSSGSERSLVDWVRRRMKDINFKNSQLADPLLKGQFPKPMFRQVLAISYACIHEDAIVRPPIGQVVVILDHVVANPYFRNRVEEAQSSGSKNKGGIVLKN